MDDIIYEADCPSWHQRSGILGIGGVARTLTATDHKQPMSVLIPVSFARGEIVKEIDTAHCLQSEALQKESLMMNQEMTKVMAVLTPDRAEKRQNGRRFKDDGEEAFTLTSQDIHGVAFSVSGEVAKESEDVAHCLNASDQRKVFGAHQTKTMVGEPLLKIKEATEQGYALAHEGDSINLSMPNSQTRRGRIGGGGGSNIGHELQPRDDCDYP